MSELERSPRKRENDAAGDPRNQSPARGSGSARAGTGPRNRSRERGPMPSDVRFSEPTHTAPAAASDANSHPKANLDDDDDAIAPSFGELVASAEGTTASVTRERETDPHRLDQRMKQVQFGKNTSGYTTYAALVPRHKRDPERKLKDHPVTPPYKYKMSKRAWDGLIKVWRRQLHFYDTPAQDADAAGAGAAVSLPSGAGDAGTPVSGAKADAPSAPAAASATAAAPMSTAGVSWADL